MFSRAVKLQQMGKTITFRFFHHTTEKDFLVNFSSLVGKLGFQLKKKKQGNKRGYNYKTQDALVKNIAFEIKKIFGVGVSVEKLDLTSSLPPYGGASAVT